jgi:hypothetical protein
MDFLTADTLAGALPIFDFSLLRLDGLAYSAYRDGNRLLFQAQLGDDTSVPTPASLPLLLVAFGLMQAVMHRRRVAPAG